MEGEKLRTQGLPLALEDRGFPVRSLQENSPSWSGLAHSCLQGALVDGFDQGPCPGVVTGEGCGNVQDKRWSPGDKSFPLSSTHSTLSLLPHEGSRRQTGNKGKARH